MNLYPAIDILDGRAVRLRQGRREHVTDYGTPVEMAERWARAGAGWLHVVDLDGAFEGQPVNWSALRDIRHACSDLRIQFGGGIREMAHLERLLDGGIDRVVLGTAAVENAALLDGALARYRQQVAVGIDAREGRVRLGGWTKSTSMRSLDLALEMENRGVELIIYTDIARDGELTGVNVEGNRSLLDATGVRIIASGGVSSTDDILQLHALDHPRLEGVIIGKALYEGRIKLKEILAVTHAG